ncbi:tetratricopeptide repeat protein [Sulfitobacter sp. M57]|uniref:tetratricopeptide repeat protein n=1 Tax=unclassified Sulfitobacter TaxID=196795 RepID=UPI0023E1D4E3|nr:MULTISPECIES: tetratricopeptide repeat protein [unclassified Sulfitobacter]MDF3415565.1 tetratricopeptide repeat protein [Sulfitobacter sp. KE5]MDF3423046.1 tetratricopeptide repeat protein [Sulfitobacter sp. KE43]MDF3434111.1 tetratricopeptide repeat protein [Sulfitobacter sp. KE42]MDF3459856.1 tetratricopeptide repeat protein [Sulfitobacter sp. S74]MDF3463650.1 tetratricopeptide repeat protein [Sulfitobacter sp. Ks18]
MFRNVLTGAAALLLSAAFIPQANAQSVAGAYLAGRHAAVKSDYREAARYYAEALARDSSNVELIESTVLSYLSLGRVEQAVPLARVLEQKNQTSQVARMVITADLAQREEYGELLARASDSEGIGPWVDGLVKAWAHVGKGDVTSAMVAFDALSKEAGMQGFVLYHKALALASVGDFEGAERIFGTAAAGAAGQTRRGVMAHAVVLAQLERHEDALAVLQTSFGDATDPELDQMIVALKAKEPLPFTLVRDAKSGIAEVFFTFAAVLKSETAGDYYVLLYSRVARFLRPGHVDALLLTAGLLENLGQNDLAIEEYKAVPADDPAFHVAELGRADTLRRSGKEDQAIEVLEQLARSHGDLAVVHSTLGDVQRGQGNFADAIAAYDRAIARIADTARARWVLYYSRGIAYERSGNAEMSEADFRAALAINPEQPQVLNYLGYSMVEQNRNLEEALDMIERAVAASPQSGYIVDSLGWVLYRMGRYEEAVAHMERAVELVAVDPVVNDHLGDVYWAVGRQREAEFQWSRALSFIDEKDNESEADPDRIRRKLEIGLDQVLAEEGAPPLKVANDL